MRSRFARHLHSVLRTGTRDPARLSSERPAMSPEFTGHQYAIFLLRVAAAIEHALMAQYLFAAYSLGGPNVAPRHAVTVARWQEAILGIAKEEMGHLITLQNVLRLISGPISFEREDYPFDAAFYPFDFTLEKLTLASLAKYVYAEKPFDWTGPLADEITRLATEGNHDVPLNLVSKLYQLMIETLADPALVPDRAFRADTEAGQASWNEWGRGYAHGARGNVQGGSPAGSPDLIIRTFASREDAVAALRAIAEQGEATTLVNGERSHFERFLTIYSQWKVIARQGAFVPARPVAQNPVVEGSLAAPGPTRHHACTVITHPVTFCWAHLFNLRYRLLLSGLTHIFESPDAAIAGAHPTAHGELITLVFGEMYKLRGLASVLVELPVHRDVAAVHEAAGPPFEMPYTLNIPLRESDRWRWHLDMLVASRGILRHLAILDADAGRRGFSAALRDSDAQLIRRIELIIAGLEQSGSGETV